MEDLTRCISAEMSKAFPTLIKELNINLFDTGYPIQFETLRDEVGEEIHIQGGVPVSELLRGTPESVATRAKEILQSGIMKGGKFIMKEANNVPPCMRWRTSWLFTKQSRPMEPMIYPCPDIG